MRKLSGVMLVAGCVLVLQLPAHAALLSSSLSITNGDKVFNDFTCNLISVGTTTGSCGTVDVSAATDAFGNFGIRFQLSANITTINSNMDYSITYDVTAPATTIHDIHMAFNGNITGSGSTNVTEQVNGINPATGIVGQITVQNPPPVLDKDIVLSQLLQKAHVSKDIQLAVGSAAGTANISTIDQYISQTGVPEPGSIVLFGTLMLGVTTLVRRRRSV